MIRWSYVFPRLLLVGLAVLFFTFALDPLVRLLLLTAGQAATGAKVDLGPLKTSVFQTALQIDGLEVADPQQTMTNLLEADEVILKFDTAAVLRRNWIVDYGYVRGIRLNGARSDSGELEDTASQDAEGGGLADIVADAGDHLLAGVLDGLQEDVDSLESVQLAKELSIRWPAEYDGMEMRVDQLKRQIADVRAAVDMARDNPLRALETADQTLRQLDSLRRAPAALRGELGRLKDQAQRDRVAIDEARRSDMQQIRSKVDLVRVDPEQLASYLIGDAYAGEIQTAMRWLKKGRDLLNSAGRPPEPHRYRGQDIVFAGLSAQPRFLVRTLFVDGQGTIERQPFHFAGVVKDLTSQPDVYGQPTVVQLQTTGAAEAQVHVVIDHTGETPQAQIVIDCPQLKQKATTLGRSEKVAVSVPAGSAHLWARFQLTDYESLAGQIVFHRDQVELTPTVGEAYKKNLKTTPWDTALRDVHSMHVAVDLSGTVTSPTYKVKSNLAEQLAGGLKQAVDTEVAAQRDALAGRLQVETDKHLARFDQLIATRQKELIEKLNLGEQEIESLKALLKKNLSGSAADIGRNSPLGKILFR